MRISYKMLAAVAVLGCSSYASATAQNHPAPSELVQRLRSVEATDEARKQLFQLGKTDDQVRHYIATELPAMIQMGPKSCPPSNIADVVRRWHTCPWYNAVELAGQLKIEEAVPALAPWVGWRTPAPFSPTLEDQLIFHPAAKALAEIGDAALPAVQAALDRGNPKEHHNAVRVLCIIHTPKAKAVLREKLPKETNPHLRIMIERSLQE